jgi:hypothetical protein
MVEPGEDDVTNCHKKRKDARLELVANHNPLFCQTVDTTELLTATKASSILVSSPIAKHTFDLPVDPGEDDATTNCHKKRKDARLEPVVDRDLLFCQTVDTTEVLSLDRHPMCFTNKFLEIMSTSQQASTSTPLNLWPPRPMVGMPVHPLDLLKRTSRQSNVAGKRIILSLDQSGLSHRFIERCRMHPPQDFPQLKLPNSQNLYFEHAAWFIECTNLHRLPRKGIGMAIAVITELKNKNKEQHSSHPATTITVELGVVLCLTREHFIYAILSNQVTQDPETKEYLPGYLLLKQESTNALTPKFMEGTFSGPFRIPTRNLVHTLNRKRFVFLNQIAGRSISHLASDPDHKKIMETCINQSDGGYQCSHFGANHLLPRDWRFPFQKQDLFVQRTGDEIGYVDRRRTDLEMFEGPNNYFPKAFKPSHPSCNFKNVQSLDCHCNTTYVLKDSSPKERLDGPLVHCKTWTSPRRTTSLRLFYAPYLLRKAPSKDHIWFAMISLADLMPHFSSESYALSPMSIADYDNLLFSISHADITLPVIDPDSHPGGFRICICDPSDREEVSVLEKYGEVLGTKNINEPSLGPPPIRENVLKRVDRRPIHEVENNYTLPWLTVFRCFPWTRETSLSTEDSLLFLNAYGDAFCDRDSVSHLGQTLYQGQRATMAVRLSPTLGEGEANRHQLYRERSYIAPMVPLAEKLGNKLFKSSSIYMRWLDPAMDSLLLYISGTLCQNIRIHYCRLKIITQGVPHCRDRAKGTWKDNLPPCLGWSSTDHCDRRDEYSKKIHESVRKNITEWKPRSQEERMVHAYLNKFAKRLGIGVPTCCGYEYMGCGSTYTGTESAIFSQSHLADGSATVHHYFVLSGLHSCVRLRPRVGNFFYAHTFAHCTSVCVGTYEGNVYLSDPMFRAFAWGGASS